MNKLLSVMKLLCLILLMIAIGFFGMDLLFSDFSPSETALDRTVTISVFYVFFGMIFGFFNAARPWVAGVIAWAAVLLGITTLFSNITDDIPVRMVLGAIMIAPLALTIMGAYGGSRLRALYRASSSEKARKKPSNRMK